MRKTTRYYLLKGVAPWCVWACCALLPDAGGADNHASGPMAMAAAPKAMTTVLAVAGPEVTLGAGSRNGVILETEVTLLREGEPIVHPLTGHVLGIPQEPVGVVHVFEVQEQTARGRMVKAYSDPMVDDLAEYVQAVVEQPAEAVDEVVGEFAQRMRELESSVQDYEKANETLTKSYPKFARRVWDEISAMRSYVVSLDERLVELEEQQSEDRSRLASVITGEYRPEDLKEFTIKYTPDTQIKLQASGKTLLISVVNDSVRIDRPALDDGSVMLDDAPGVDEEEPGELMATMGSWFDDFGGYWIWVAAAGLLIALLIMAILIIKRRYRDVMDGLEEFDDEYLDDEEQDDDDEDEY